MTQKGGSLLPSSEKLYGGSQLVQPLHVGVMVSSYNSDSVDLGSTFQSTLEAMLVVPGDQHT